MAENDPGSAIETTGWLTGLPITVMGAAMNVAKGVSDAAAVASATKAGAGFTLNRDEAQSLLERAKRLQHNTRMMIPDAEVLTRLTPCGGGSGQYRIQSAGGKGLRERQRVAGGNASVHGGTD